MSETHYNKLVRDKIPEIIRANNRTPAIHVAESDEFQAKLLEKPVQKSP